MIMDSAMKKKAAVGVKKFLFIKLKTTSKLKSLSLERLLLGLMIKKIFCMPHVDVMIPFLID